MYLVLLFGPRKIKDRRRVKSQPALSSRTLSLLEKRLL